MAMITNLLAIFILDNYFNDTGCLFVFTDNDCYDYQSFNYNGQLALVNFKLMLNDSNNQSRLKHFFGCNGFLLESNRPSGLFQEVENAIKHSPARFNDRRYLIIPHDDNYSNDDALSLLQMDEIEYVNDLLMLLPDESSPLISKSQNKYDHFWKGNAEMCFDLVTHRFVSSEHNETVYLDKWFANNQSFLHNHNLYPEKIKNQLGRALKLATFTYPPYTIPAEMDGTEMRVVNLYAKLHNMTIQLVIDEVDQWGAIYDNWTGNGIVGNVAMDKGDVGLGALYTWQRESLFLDLSQSFVRTGVTCLVPIPRLMDGWLTPLLAFSDKLWVAVGITFVLAVLTFFATSVIASRSKLREPNDCFQFQEALFNTIAIFVVQPVTIQTTGASKIFNFAFSLVLIFAVLLTTMYSSGLASNMTVPRYVGEIETVRELVESGIHWGAANSAWLISITNDTNPDVVTLIRRFDVCDDDCLSRLAFSGKFAFSIERLPGGQYAIGEYIGEDEVLQLKPMKEDIYFEHCVFMAKKSSVLMPSLNELIMQIFEAGLMEVWEYQVAMKTMNAKVQRAVRYSAHHLLQAAANNEPTALKINHLAGAFALLAFGLSLAVTIFMSEFATRFLCYKSI